MVTRFIALSIVSLSLFAQNKRSEVQLRLDQHPPQYLCAADPSACSLFVFDPKVLVWVQFKDVIEAQADLEIEVRNPQGTVELQQYSASLTTDGSRKYSNVILRIRGTVKASDIRVARMTIRYPGDEPIVVESPQWGKNY